MRLLRPRSFAPVLAATLVAGCGTATATVTAGSPASGPSSASVAAKPAGTALAASSPARQRAEADARSVLGRFVPPPGAVRLAGQPKLPDGSATMSSTSSTQVDEVGYWRASGSATALLAWEKSHISRSFSRQDVIIGPPDWNTVYSLPAVPGVLPQREMNVQFYDAGGGATVIMADAMVSWQPPRPASEVIPGTVTVVTVSPAGGTWQGHPVPVTITDVSVVRRLAALVNGLPLSTMEAGVPCAIAPAFALSFRASGDGPEVASTGLGICGGVSIRINGKDRPDLWPPSSYAATVLKLAGLHWKPWT